MQKLNVLFVHNRYLYAGGEDDVFEAEAQLLESRGHRVARLTVDNHDLSSTHPVVNALGTLWNRDAYRRVRDLCRRNQAHVVHFHNTFPQISPAGYYAARAEGAAVVQTLHNFRLVCLNAVCYRSGRPCEECVTKAVPWPGVLHKCYRNSRAASGVTAVMLSLHSAARTWTSHVDTYVALSEFARGKFIAGGIPAARLVVKPNFLVEDPGAGRHKGGFALYVGRLSPEKGVGLLLRAWSAIGRALPLKVVGSGPLDAQVRDAGPDVEWLGAQPPARVLELMKQASLLVFPSEVYENCPMTLIQAFAAGLPVVATGHGSIAEMVSDGVTGRHFVPGDADGLIRAVTTLAGDRDALAAMGVSARRTFEQLYTAERHYEQVRHLYQGAVQYLRAAA